MNCCRVGSSTARRKKDFNKCRVWTAQEDQDLRRANVDQREGGGRINAKSGFERNGVVDAVAGEKRTLVMETNTRGLYKIAQSPMSSFTYKGRQQLGSVACSYAARFCRFSVLSSLLLLAPTIHKKRQIIKLRHRPLGRHDDSQHLNSESSR